jgi:hypothetical protein
LNSDLETDEVPPPPKFRQDKSSWWWCAPIAAIMIFGFVAIGGAIWYLFGTVPEGADWGYYYLNVFGFLVGIVYLWTEWRKRNPKDL